MSLSRSLHYDTILSRVCRVTVRTYVQKRAFAIPYHGIIAYGSTGALKVLFYMKRRSWTCNTNTDPES